MPTPTTDRMTDATILTCTSVTSNGEIADAVLGRIIIDNFKMIRFLSVVAVSIPARHNLWLPITAASSITQLLCQHLW